MLAQSRGTGARAHRLARIRGRRVVAPRHARAVGAARRAGRSLRCWPPPTRPAGAWACGWRASRRRDPPAGRGGGLAGRRHRARRGLRGAPRRAVPRLRRALERRGPARTRSWRTTWARAPTRRRTGRSPEPWSRPGASSAATTPPTSRFRGCSPRAATACSSTTPRRATSGWAPRLAGRLERGGPRSAAGPAAGRGRPGAVALSLRVFAGPDAGGRAAALHRRDRQAARARGAVVLRAVVPALG